MSLAQFIQKTIEAEHQIEAYRIQMANISEFEPNTVYKRLDQPRLGGVKIADLAEFASDHNLELTIDALNYLFNYFDIDEDGIITREDFLKVVLSRENLKLADEVQQREPYEIQVAMFLPHDVEEALFGFFMIILDNYQQLQQINLEGVNLDNEKIYDRDGFITIQSISSYLENQNIEIDDYAIIPFIQLLDKNEVGKATQEHLQKFIDSVRAQEEEYNEQQFEPYEEALEQSQENLKDTIKREQIPVEQENESDESLKPPKVNEQEKQQQEKQQEKQQEQEQVKQQEKQQEKQQQPPQDQQTAQKSNDKQQEIEKQKQIEEQLKNQQMEQQKEKEQKKAQQEQFKQDAQKAKQQLEDDQKKNVKQEKEQPIQQPLQEENKYNSQQTFKPNQSKAEDKEDKTEQKQVDVPQSYQKNDGLLELYYREIQREKERQQIIEQEIDYVKGIKELYKPSPQKANNLVYQSPQKKNFKAESEIDLYLLDIERRRREIQFEIELEKSKQKYLPEKELYREPYSTSLERINFQIELEIQRIKRISEQNHKQQPANDILSMSNTGILDKINKQYPQTTPSRDYMKASQDEITPPKEVNEEISKDKSKPLKYQQEKILIESQEMK